MINIKYEKLDKIFINKIQGELSIKTIDEFNAILQIQIDLSPKIIALDCKELNYLDSTGLNHLFKLSKKLSETDIEIIYLDLPNNIVKLFKLTYLNKISNISSEENFKTDYLH